MNKKLSVVVPYRDRQSHLDEFLNTLPDYLSSEGILFHIYIINQVDECLFNRAKLLNVGFLESCETSDYTAFHDIDMLPIKSEAGYHYTETARQVHSPTIYSMGGISIVNNNINKDVNGWANSYWGWGGEDRNYMHRLRDKNIVLEESQGFRGWDWAKDHFRELEGLHDPARKKFKKTQRAVTKKFLAAPELNSTDGLNSCDYTVVSKVCDKLHTIVDVDLLCEGL